MLLFTLAAGCAKQLSLLHVCLAFVPLSQVQAPISLCRSEFEGN